MRLFVALWPPHGAVAHLEATLAEIRGAADELRWTTPATWHLTLTFLGEVPDAVRPDLEARLARAARRHDPLELRLDGAGRFSQQVLFAGVGGERERLGRLAASTTAAARRAGLDVEERHYRPHLTLARAPRSGADLGEIATALRGYEGPTWTAASMALVSSHSGGVGRPAVHQSVADWALGTPGARR